MKRHGKLILISLLFSQTKAGFDGTCIKDNWSRVLKHQRRPDSRSNTPENCGKYCLGKGYKYSGVQYRKQCFCGNNAPPSSTIRPKKECSYKCTGDKKQICGGSWRMNVYETSKFSSKSKDAKCDDGQVRLTSHPKGRVELCKDGTWGTLCGHFWWDNQKGAENICKQLGYSGGTKYTAPGGSGPIHVGNRLCQGGEQTVWDCPLQAG